MTKPTTAASSYHKLEHFQVSNLLYQFINQDVLPETGVDQASFWSSLESYLQHFIPKNKSLLVKREQLQAQIDQWHQQHPSPFDANLYQQFLSDIAYLVDAPENVTLSTSKVDRELALLAGPQLVVPVMNARYALNAANARWGSLYDALYGTDAIDQSGELEPGSSYNPQRGAAVIAYGRALLDQHCPLAHGSHADATRYSVLSGGLLVSLKDGSNTTLAEASHLAGFQGDAEQPSVILLQHHGLHIEIQFDAEHQIGEQDSANVKDIVLESALTTIMDCEDSIAAVDAEDKVEVYKNWLGLMRGSLRESLSKNGQTITRELEPNRHYVNSQGHGFSLSGRSLMFVRNVGHLMNSDLLLDADGNEVPEGLLDAVFTSLIGKHDLLGNSPYRNSREGSIYIVKPKMHGPEEVAFSNQVFGAVEEFLGLATNTIKLGIMDEERRTSVNLQACIAEANQRVVFINTGFLDRTGDEIHTSMHAAAMVPKGQIKESAWIKAYELNNVEAGLACGLQGKAQIGKGMWAMPEMMAAMMQAKQAHPQSGASTAWVPSPTAATLHAIHYHQVDVFSVQQQLAQHLEQHSTQRLADLLTPPLAEQTDWSEQQLIAELDNNIQGILGYVVRWVEQGVGCSKVPDINGVGLMEDRATLRISSQHVANWLKHGVVSESLVKQRFEVIANLVDQQNAGDPLYLNMAGKAESSFAYQAALDLVFKGCEQPSGYTEPLLHAWRRKFKTS
ncbi:MULTISPECIES: malate synthase G [unclassified Agarivorans]|uniref:malate synthase G n=1 Tax=unclassified Agarivorans TaxID=2636026 RepID=UPI0026E2E421|nr:MULTISPECIES: malate synthase G [unclassified Agarivorans]MDO6684533.1 malate synthase G [Agarivorans sp. 3_MG-2023]MDO6714698.1 malate synthase G [Agarivorans sp. 2_MG-2023]